MAVDRDRIKVWYEQYNRDLYRYVYYLCRDEQLAEDILHDTFVKLLSGRYIIDPEKIRAWLYRTAHNLCCDQLRRNRKHTEELETWTSEENHYGYIELLAHLPQKDRDIVSMKIIGGLNHREIAAVLGISVAAAQKRYERAIATLREKEDTYGTKTT